MSKLSENSTSRLASLDILRGFDLFLLVFFQPVFAALARQLNLPFLNDILYQFDHEVWARFIHVLAKDMISFFFMAA